MEVDLLYGNGDFHPQCCSSHRHAFKHHLPFVWFRSHRVRNVNVYLWMQPENDEEILITTYGWVFNPL